MSNLLHKNNNPHGELDKFQYVPRSNASNSQTSVLDPHKIISILLKYKWIVALFLVMGATAAWFYADTVTPTYLSNGKIIISSTDQSPTDELSKIISQTTGQGTSSTLENELQVLQSRKFALQVAEDLISKEPGSRKEFPILWQADENGDVYKSSQDKVADKIEKGTKFQKVQEESDVIEVSFISPSPEEAAEVVNAVMETYITISKQQSRKAAQATTEFLEQEKQKLQGKLQESEQELRRYMDSTGLVDVEEQSTGMVAQKSDTEAELRRINLELEAITENIGNYENQLERVKPGLSEQFSEAIGPRIRNSQEMLARMEQEKSLIIAKNPGVLQRDPLPSRLQYLNKEITRLKSEIDSMSQKLFTSDNEFLGINGEDRAEMVSRIQTRLVELRMQKNQLESRRSTLSTHKNEMDANFNSLPEGMVKLAKLQREVRINEELYLNVLRQYADMSVLRQSQFGFGRVVDPGYVPDIPVGPNKKIFLVLGLMLGGILAAGYIFIKEFRDNSINNVGQLRTIYLPPITVIPSFEKLSNGDIKSFEKGKGKVPKELVLLQNNSSIASEAVRRLKNNIIYQQGEKPPQTIVITSAEKGDGKSTVASNLGIALAEEGYWTLIIGTDFRRPKLHKYFGLDGENGLVNYLQGELTFDELIQDTDVDTLKIISAGSGADIPDVISNSTKFQKLMEKMKEVFDVIILDTPPYGIISDSTAMLKQADATVVVAKYRKTNKGMMFRTMEELEQINANVISIVLNDFDYRKETNSYYGSGYYQSLYSNYEDYL
ncbi:GumC family protein [Fodinibius salsisoli]|uniref:Polysaccharide biosynthesis tyrosine autokinase n=1 Tax=Fodinibius salsisoli TaxID=2820877 RepID=A0ABT3PLI2_9BACT|nr:polysaccharide biosynthesis tyrosine autokinase [Fodinibius salsisoli]MCW9706781.1 polysaccharide biosynthesis tyrosine autokinase [Fodinibius salsisoli]